MTNIKICGGQTNDISSTIKLYQGYELSLLLFIIVMDKLYRTSWCVLFADNIVLDDKTRIGINTNYQVRAMKVNVRILRFYIK